MNKKVKVIIGVLVAVIIALVAVMIIAFNTYKNETNTGGELVSVTELVTDESGEAVTDANGELVTETVDGELVTDANGEAVTEAVTNKYQEVYTNKNGTVVTHHVTEKHRAPTTEAPTKQSTKKSKTTTTTKKGETTTTQKGEASSSQNSETPANVVKQPDAPDEVKDFKVSDVKKDSVKLSWKKLDCSGYQIRYRAEEKDWKYVLTSSTSLTLKDLQSYTEYTFQIRGYQEYAGSKIAIDNWVEIKQATKVDEDTNDYINIIYTLPIKGKADKMIIWVMKDGDKDWSKDSVVNIENCDGMKHSVKTKEKYKGLVKIKVELTSAGIQATTKLTDKKEITLDLVDTNIEIVQGEDD